MDNVLEVLDKVKDLKIINKPINNYKLTSEELNLTGIAKDKTFSVLSPLKLIVICKIISVICIIN